MSLRLLLIFTVNFIQVFFRVIVFVADNQKDPALSGLREYKTLTGNKRNFQILLVVSKARRPCAVNQPN